MEKEINENTLLSFDILQNSHRRMSKKVFLVSCLHSTQHRRHSNLHRSFQSMYKDDEDETEKAEVGKMVVEEEGRAKGDAKDRGGCAGAMHIVFNARCCRTKRSVRTRRMRGRVAFLPNQHHTERVVKKSTR